MDRSLQILGMARKAGLLAIGSEDVGLAARTGKASLVVSASDASDGSLRRARRSAETGDCVYTVVPYKSEELGNITGRGSPGTIAILDHGLATKFISTLAITDPTRYSDTAEVMMLRAEMLKKTGRHTSSAKRRTAQ